MSEYKLYVSILPTTTSEVVAVVRSKTTLTGDIISASFTSEKVTCLVDENYIEIIQEGNP